MLILVISWKVLKGLKLNFIHTLMLMKGSTEDKNHTPILHFTWIISPYNFFIMVVFFVMSWCTSDVGLQVLPFIDNSHLWNILRIQRFTCLIHLWLSESSSNFYSFCKSNEFFWFLKLPLNFLPTCEIITCVPAVGINVGVSVHCFRFIVT